MINQISRTSASTMFIETGGDSEEYAAHPMYSFEAVDVLAVNVQDASTEFRSITGEIYSLLLRLTEQLQ